MTTRMPECLPGDVCITCADAAEPMRIESVAADGTLATCVGDDGKSCDVMLGLVPEAAVGSRVLVHAGVALLVMNDAAEPADTSREVGQ